MATIFYLRVSTKEQSTDNQLKALSDAGFSPDKVFQEKVSGRSDALSRPQWRACFEYLREGDTLVVYAVDRLGRSTIDCLNTIKALDQKGVRLVILKQGFDTTSPAGKLALTMFSAFAEFENEIRRERQMAGISRMKAEGRLTGRPKALSEDKLKKAKDLIGKGMPKAQIARELRIDRSTLYRALA